MKIQIPTQYNNAVLTDEMAKELVNELDKILAMFFEIIEGMCINLEQIYKLNEKEKLNISTIQLETALFTAYVYNDSAILLKFFIISKNYYEKSLFRGKLQVLLNEGFKKLYHFKEDKRKESLLSQLGLLVRFFPEYLDEYKQVVADLEEISKQDTWWKEERDAEVHLDVYKLHKSRKEPINESKVAIETISFIYILQNINDFSMRINQSYIDRMDLNIKSQDKTE